MKNLEYYLDLNYDIVLRQLNDDEGGGWFAEIPLLPGCMSDGETPEEALKNINDAKKCWIEVALQHHDNIPEPVDNQYSGQLRIRIPKTLHKSLAERAKQEKVSLNQLILHKLSMN
jgi:predicted RNase H-like HicB family nuclease